MNPTLTAALSLLLGLAVVFVVERLYCPFHFSRNRYVSLVSGGRKCEGCAEEMRAEGGDEEFNERWLAENWRKL